MQTGVVPGATQTGSPMGAPKENRSRRPGASRIIAPLKPGGTSPQTPWQKNEIRWEISRFFPPISHLFPTSFLSQRSWF